MVASVALTLDLIERTARMLCSLVCLEALEHDHTVIVCTMVHLRLLFLRLLRLSSAWQHVGLAAVTVSVPLLNKLAA